MNLVAQRKEGGMDVTTVLLSEDAAPGLRILTINRPE